jgi:hypothetical protein
MSKLVKAQRAQNAQEEHQVCELAEHLIKCLTKPIDRPFQDQRGSHPFQGKGGDEGRLLAPITWHACSSSLALGSTCIEGGQRNVRATLINTHKSFRGPLVRVLSPRGSLLLVALAARDFFSRPAKPLVYYFLPLSPGIYR